MGLYTQATADLFPGRAVEVMDRGSEDALCLLTFVRSTRGECLQAILLAYATDCSSIAPAWDLWASRIPSCAWVHGHERHVRAA